MMNTPTETEVPVTVGSATAERSKTDKKKSWIKRLASEIADVATDLAIVKVVS